MDVVTLPDQPPAPPPVAAIPQRESLVSLTAESLRAHLRAGHWQARMPSERELCAHLQVSRPTIRAALRALEQQGWIKLEGRMRSPVRHSRKRMAPPTASRIVRVLTPAPLEQLPGNALIVLDSLRERLSKFGYTVDTHSEPLSFRAQPNRALERLIQSHPAAAWMAWGSKEPMQRWFVEHRVPIVIVGSCRPEIPLPSVDIDFRATCMHAADLLWRKGHRRLALVMQQDAYGGDIDSEEGFREAVSHHPGADLRVLRHDGTATHICSLLNRALRGPSSPTAFFVLRAVHALTVMTHLLRCKLSIPQDVGVLSRDDESYFQHTSPTLARYAVDSQLVARRVVNMVRELVDTGVCSRKAVRLIPRLIPGETLG
jgi:DNA-binding LacI/PurR family transcriptional regulator